MTKELHVEWKPYPDRKPEKHGQYLVTLGSPMFEFQRDSFRPYVLIAHYGGSDGGFILNLWDPVPLHVSAWMEKPQPWSKEDEE